MDAGAYIEFDNCGKEYFMPRRDTGLIRGRFAYDYERAQLIAALVERGYKDRILLSNDICLKSMRQRTAATASRTWRARCSPCCATAAYPGMRSARSPSKTPQISSILLNDSRKESGRTRLSVRPLSRLRQERRARPYFRPSRGYRRSVS